ncbi:hypothetical protein M427DRAFT_103922, partial [Gonapodya prolifera JEL478]
ETEGHVLTSSTYDTSTFCTHGGGPVDVILRAYRGHCSLILQPEDAWIAITTQFARYVEANAEVLRGHFVSFEGKRALSVTFSGSLTSPAIVESVARSFEQVLEANVTDPALCAWIVPSFSTTTPTDRAVGRMMLMTTCKSYFRYAMCICGIPNITLEGIVADWCDVHRRAERLREYGGRCAQWVDMLGPVLKHFTATAGGVLDADFWEQVCHTNTPPNAYSTLYVPSWVTVFRVLDEHGRWMDHTVANPEGEQDDISDTFLNTDQVQDTAWTTR